MLSRGFKHSLLITAFFVACAAPVYAQTAETEPAPAAAAAEPGLGTISGTVSKVTASGFTLTHDRGDTPVLTNAQTERGEIGALKDGDRVTIIGKVNQEAKAVEARSITRVQSSASAAPAGATESQAEPSAQAAASAVAAQPPAESAAASAAPSEVAASEAAPPSQMASAAPSAADAEVEARLKLSAEADLPTQVMAEVSDGNYTTADLNRAALMAMNAAPMPVARPAAAVEPAAATDAAPAAAPDDSSAAPPVAPEEAAPAGEDAGPEAEDM